MVKSKNNEKDLKNFLHMLHYMSPLDQITNDLEEATQHQYAKTWAKVQIRFFDISAEDNEANALPAKVSTQRKFHKSRIPVRIPQLETYFDFRRSCSLKYQSTPINTKAPRSLSAESIPLSDTSYENPIVTFATPKPLRRYRGENDLTFKSSSDEKIASSVHKDPPVVPKPLRRSRAVNDLTILSSDGLNHRSSKRSRGPKSASTKIPRCATSNKYPPALKRLRRYCEKKSRLSDTSHKCPGAPKPLRKYRAENDLTFQSSRDSSPESIRAPKLHNSPVLNFATPKPLRKYCGENDLTFIQRSDSFNYCSNSKSGRNPISPSLIENTPPKKVINVLEVTSPPDGPFFKSISLGNKSTRRVKPSLITNTSDSEEDLELIMSEDVCECASRQGRSSTFTQDLKNFFADLKNLSIARCLK